MTRLTLAFFVVLGFSTVTVGTAAELRPETLAAWNAYVARSTDRPGQFGSGPDGQMIDVPGGTIYRSWGSTLVRGTTVDRVVRALLHPGTPPPQDDVLESRVISHSGDSLRVYLKLTRTSLVTVVYDTEHQVTFARHSPTLVTSRSVSTRIAESGGGDRGFLWRLNSYWRYTQVGNDVRVDMESLSLSRAVPAIARPVARPVIDRIARDSVRRTLESVRKFLEARA